MPAQIPAKPAPMIATSITRASSSPLARRRHLALLRSARRSLGHPPRRWLVGGTSPCFARLADHSGILLATGSSEAPRLASLGSPITRASSSPLARRRHLALLRSARRSLGHPPRHWLVGGT